MTAEDRVAYALRSLPGQHILSSSFGAQSAVMLHLVTRQAPDIPVVLIDTGYLFAETYHFIDTLRDRLQLNLHVYAPRMSAAWQEARYGRRWEDGVQGLQEYNYDAKVEPMKRAISDLRVGTWFSGLRRNQAAERASTPFIEAVGDRFKVHPIADWSDKDVFNYLQRHELPYHPLWDKGYVSIGDTHTTQSLTDVESISETRFFGLKRECGLHEMNIGDSSNAVKSA